MTHDVIIIGSGLGGLECGFLLSEAGMDVLVLESGAQPGGCLQSYRRQGLDFDTGLHYVGGLGEGQSLHGLFRHLGLLRLPWQQLDERFDRVHLGGHTFALAQGYEHFVQTLADDFPAERQALTRYADLLRLANAHQLDALHPHPAHAASSPLEAFETNAYEYLNDLFGNLLLVNVLAGASMKMELRRESLPLFTFVHGQSSFVESSWRLKGKGAQVAETLAEGIRAHGGQVRCHAHVNALTAQGGRLTAAICADGSRHEARQFIADIHPDSLCQLLTHDNLLKPAYRHRMARLENTFGMLTVSVSVNPGRLPYANWNTYLYRNPDVWSVCQHNDPVQGLMVSCRVPDDGGPWVRQIDLLCPMTWQQCQPWADTTVGHRGETYLQLKQRLAHACLALAEEAIPGLQGELSACYVSTPLTYRDYLHAPQGSAYGVRKDCRNALGTLLSVRTPVPNLFMTGQHLMLHGIHGVSMTALHTCAEVIGKDYLWHLVQP